MTFGEVGVLESDDVRGEEKDVDGLGSVSEEDVVSLAVILLESLVA